MDVRLRAASGISLFPDHGYSAKHMLPQGRGHMTGNVTLDGKYISELPVVFPGPLRFLIQGIDELDADPDLVPHLPDTPSSTLPTFNSLPISAMDLLVPLYLITEVRAMTRRPFVFETEEIISSVIPSARYSSAASMLMLVKGRTATLSVGIMALICLGRITLCPNPETRNTSIGMTTFLSSGIPSDLNT